MIRINLLPEEFQVRKRKLRISPHWGFVVAAVVGFFLLLSLLTLWQRSQLNRLETEIRQTRVEAERQKADLKLVRELTALKEKILQRMQVVEQLNQNRTRWIEILTALSQSVPEDMWLVTFKEKGTDAAAQAQIQGMCFSLKPIALFMDRMEETEWFSRPRFTFARRVAVPDGMAYDFEVVADLFSYERIVFAQETFAEEKNLKEEEGSKKGKGKKG